MATIVKRGNSYRIRCYDGYDSNGKQIERCMTWTPEPGMSEAKIKKEVKKQAEIFEINVKNGLYAVRRMKFSEYAEQWFSEYAEINLKPKTVSDFRDLLPRVNDNIGHLYLDKIRPSHLIKMRDNLMQTRIVPTYKARNPRLLRDKCKQQSRTLKAFAVDATISKMLLSRVPAPIFNSLRVVSPRCHALPMVTCAYALGVLCIVMMGSSNSPLKYFAFNARKIFSR